MAAYLRMRKCTAIWYEVDADDRDPGTLVAHLARTLAGTGRGRSSAPVRLAPVHPEALRQQAELVFGKILSRRPDRGTPLFLVLDNYQEADESDAWNDLVAGLAAAWALAAPLGSRVLVTSRRRPPARLARHVADGKIAMLDVDLVRFDEAEMRGLLRARLPARTRGSAQPGENEAVHKLLALSGGWAVAAVLLTGPDSRARPGAPATNVIDEDESFFDYLGAEVVRHLSETARRALAHLAFAHRIDARALTNLAPFMDFKALQVELGRVALPFTRDTDGAIRLHDLVRAFARKRLVPTLSPMERAQSLSASARYLSEEGHLQEAAALCREAESWEELTALICMHAPVLVGQGRAATVTVALHALPTERIDANPWLALWRAVCEMPADLAVAERRLVAVVAQFQTAGDPVGRKLAAACAIQAIALRGDDLRAALPLLGVLDEPIAQPLPLPIEARVRASRLLALEFLEPGSPASQRAADSALELPPDPTQVADAITSYGLAVAVYVNAARLEDAETTHRRAAALARTAPHDPLAQLAFLHGEAWLHFMRGDQPEALAAAEQGISLAQMGGIVAWRSNLANIGAMAAAVLADLPKARQLLGVLEDGLQKYPSKYQRGAFLYTRAWCRIAGGEDERALADLRATRTPALKAGFPTGLIAACQAEMFVLASCGRLDELEEPRRTLSGFCPTFSDPIFEITQETIESLAELRAHGPWATRPRLTRLLARAREIRVSMMPAAPARFWQPLVGAALELGIEPSYVATLVRRYSLQPPADDTGPVWPWPVVVRTLGPFSVEAKGGRSNARPPSGPLRMFKALIAAGGHPVRRERLAADLWARSNAVEARAVFDTTLHRLRRYLGDDSLVRFVDGEVSLDQRRFWCDAWALVHFRQQVAKTAPAAGVDEIDRLDGRLLSLHRGPFCSDEPETFIVRARESIARTFAETASILADAWLRVGEVKRAVALLEAVIDADDLNEPVYAKLIAVHNSRGAAAEAARLYDRCSRTLRARLGVDPSPQTAHAVVRDS